MTIHFVHVESPCGRILENFEFDTSAHVPRIGEKYESTITNAGMVYNVVSVKTKYTPTIDSTSNVHTYIKVESQ